MLAGGCAPAGAFATDVDDDGRADLLAADLPSCTTSKAIGLDDSAVMVTRPAWDLSPSKAGSELVLVDLNGDGLKDAVYPAGDFPTGHEAVVRWNTGAGFGPFVPLSNLLMSDDTINPSGSVYGDRGSAVAAFWAKHTARDQDTGAETTQWFDNQTRVESAASHVAIYPYATLPWRTREVVPILEEPQAGGALVLPSSAVARVRDTTRMYGLRWGHGERTFTSEVLRWTSQEWEEHVAIAPNATVTLLESPSGNIALLRTRQGSASYDDYGNALTVQAWTDNGVHTVTRREYDNTITPSTWLPGLLRVEETQAYEAGAPVPEARRVEHDYDTLGRLLETRVEPNHPELSSKAILHRTNLGLVDMTTCEGAYASTRHTYVAYDAPWGERSAPTLLAMPPPPSAFSFAMV